MLVCCRGSPQFSAGVASLQYSAPTCSVNTGENSFCGHQTETELQRKHSLSYQHCWCTCVLVITALQLPPPLITPPPQLLTASADCHSGLWDVESKAAVKLFAGHTGEVLRWVSLTHGLARMLHVCGQMQRLCEVGATCDFNTSLHPPDPTLLTLPS